MATTLPNIHHNELTMDEIRAALAVGKEVTTHTDAISVPGWSGAGYIIMDPETGIGAYKIGGGMNGGEYIDSENLEIMNIFYSIVTSFDKIGSTGGFVASSSKTLPVLGNLLSMVGFMHNYSSLESECGSLIAGAVASFSFMVDFAMSAMLLSAIPGLLVASLFMTIMLVLVISIAIAFLSRVIVELSAYGCSRR